MGPNMYITPPGGFTHFHQDGHGTVDSGHFCLMGYNEVVMLRRLTERHKQHALWLLTRDRSRENDMSFYDGLYQLPHDDGLVRFYRTSVKSQLDDYRSSDVRFSCLK